MKGPLESPDPGRGSAQADARSAQAADWVARRDLGLSAAEEAEFARWASHERNREALARTSRLWSLLERPRETGAAEGMVSELAVRARRRGRRRRALGAVAAIGAAAAALVWLFPRPAPPLILAANSELRQESLPDGSVIDLKADAAVEVRFSPDLRRVNLIRGEALFHVSKNRARPFVVAARGVEVRAVGTAFAVRLDPESIDVLVTEGRVAVERSAETAAGSAARPLAFVDAGNRFVVSSRPPAPGEGPSSVQPVTPAEFDRRLAWRYPRLEFSGTRLDQAVVLFNRDSEINGGVRLVIGDDRLAGVEVSGFFRPSNVDGFVRLLEESFGVSAERRPDGEIVLRAR